MISDRTQEGSSQVLDPFAEIALREHPLAKDGMTVIRPREWKRRLFRRGDKAAERLIEPGFEDRLSRFGQELAELRGRYRPYLRRLSPPPAYNRPSRELVSFDFRYEEGGNGEFARVLRGEGEWKRVSIPDFRGPTKEEGRWTGYYRTTFSYPKTKAGKKVFLVFKAVDYEAAVYVNGKCAGMHEGLFAPFEFDITSLLEETNVLVVEVKNDYPMMGVNGTRLDGDKMYAATGPGWDEPVYGWHHCPPGAGIYNSVFLEERAELFVEDIFIKPNPEDGSFEAWIDVMNMTAGLIEGSELTIDVFADNFEGEGLSGIRFPIAYAGPGMNNYRYKILFPAFRSWEPDAPHLYRLRASLDCEGRLLDAKDRCFGMRSFRMDEAAEPKGSLFLNGRPILLRGANEMGHLQQCIMRGDEEQLIDDILIAKLANLNFYRITQRPVQEEIYDFMDRLGMMNQCDLPAFGYIRRSKFCEAVRQAAEMERLIRSHPSVVMVSLINEPSRPAKRGKGHRHLYRDELEAFFSSARHAIYIENPDRVVKNADGDYDPPTETGLSDFHCYTMWYTNHMISFGELYKGGLPPLKKGWKSGCGEYGSEALDHYALMLKRYPREWLPKSPDDPWMPDAIVDSQTYSHHGDWYPESDRIGDWIERSQRYQATVTRLMTDAIRRRSDLIVQSAIHLLIDAWPSGWMKALVGADRVPKPAYFAYRDSLEPLRVHWRSDRWRAYTGELVELEAWLLNDTPDEYQGLRLVATLRNETEDYASFELEADIGSTDSAYVGSVPFVMPAVDRRRTLQADISLYNRAGELINSERIDIEVFANNVELIEGETTVTAAAIGTAAEALFSAMGVRSRSYAAGLPFDVIALSSAEAFRLHETEIARAINAGARAIIIPDERGEAEWRIGDITVRQEKAGSLYTLAFDEADKRLERFGASEFQFFYNKTLDRMDALTGCGWCSESMSPLLYTYAKPGSGTASAGSRKRRVPVVGSVRLGRGELIFMGLRLEGRMGCNPPLDLLLHEIIFG
ncbi:glycoside hydrolase family 2 TIM barrel-domain containing protein [Paenibacillus sp. LHD-38]|uniref:glycoside hydrolase family 2 protein n=1 Tax=Paenibacillus sp. LHD-38 TaxID=3072143 RepID=UPI00281041B8|nr:glycoside hydrolase family 2 TIM barrel-domain containing protein [Paenibacillus sp. LHD-38]MDQ8735370.1 glycoside hydrolase family 2 TIM barrel-domain containing protein [Paenibacillus sp. LHD-38]